MTSIESVMFDRPFDHIRILCDECQNLTRASVDSRHIVVNILDKVKRCHDLKRLLFCIKPYSILPCDLNQREAFQNRFKLGYSIFKLIYLCILDTIFLIQIFDGERK